VPSGVAAFYFEVTIESAGLIIAGLITLGYAPTGYPLDKQVGWYGLPALSAARHPA